MAMGRLFFIFFCAISFPIALSAQTAVQYSLFNQHKIAINPAYAGAEEHFVISAHARIQWLGLDESPVSQHLSLQTALSPLNSGIGIEVLNDKLGAERNTSLKLTYAYKLKIKSITLSLGGYAGLFQKKFFGSRLITPEGVYQQSINHNDLILSEIDQTAMTYDLGFGFALYQDKFSIGLAFHHLANTSHLVDNLRLSTPLQLFVNASYKVPISRTFDLNPFVLVKSDLQSFQTDIGLNLGINSRYNVGFSARGYNKTSLDAFILLLGMELSSKFTVSYSYEAGVSSLKSTHKGSHGVLVVYKLPNLFNAKTGSKEFLPKFL